MQQPIQLQLGNEYIIFVKRLMFDLYQALLPAISIITVLNLIALKLSLKNHAMLIRIHQKRQSLQSMIKGDKHQEESAIKSLLKFMLLNFTPIEFFAVRRARFKLAFLFAISITLFAAYFVESPFFLAPIGTVVYFAYFLVVVASQKQANQENQQEMKYQTQKYLQIVFSITSIILNLLVIRLVYKSYLNSKLLLFIQNACTNIAIDNFLVRPLLIVLVSFPLSRSTKAVEYAFQCERSFSLLKLYEQIGEKQILVKPKKMFSPSKLASRIPFNFQIQPPVINQQLFIQREEKEYNKAFDMLKKIKKQKLLPPININLQANLEGQLSLNSLFNSTKKNQNFQNQEPLQVDHKKVTQRPQQNQRQVFQLSIKKKFRSQNLILVNPSRQQQAENQEKITEQGQNNAENHQEKDEMYDTIQQKHTLEENFPVKISCNSSEHQTSRQQTLRISINGEANLQLQENQQEEDQIQAYNYRNKRELNTIDQNCIKNSFGVLQIKDQNHAHHPSEQIEQIYLNSPQNRKGQQIYAQSQLDSKISIMKRKKKKFSHDNNHNRVIKFSTGQPYLQYLPHMLAKDNKGKKSQAINKKDVVVDTRAINSVKRPKKRLAGQQNNENMVPEFKIQDL